MAKVSEDEVLLLWRALVAYRSGPRPACRATGKPPRSRCPLHGECPRRRGPGDDYFAEMAAQLGELAFRRGMLISARLGKGSKGVGYTLQRQPEQQSWRDRLPGRKKPGYTFALSTQDEAGMRMLSELESRGLNGTANAVAQSVDHIRSFFQMLRAELGFYIGCLNLREPALAKGAAGLLSRPGEPGHGPCRSGQPVRPRPV